MSYTFKEDSNENFVVVNLKSSFVRKILNRDMDGQQEIDLEEAIGAIEGSDVYNNPDGGRTIVKWFPGGVLAGDVNVVIGQDDPTPSDLLSVLSFVGDCQENAIFIVGLDVGRLDAGNLKKGERHLPEFLKALLPETITKLQDNVVPGKKLILVCTGGDPTQFFPNFKYSKGELLPEKQIGTKPFKFKEFKKVVERNKPESNVYWEFADDERWIECIDNLNQDDIKELVENGLHLKPIERIRNALKEVQRRFVRRDHALEIMVACALARANIVFLGPPGTAKSLMVRTFAQTLGVRSENRKIKNEDKAAREARRGKRPEAAKRHMFEYLLTRYTTPEEIFGGADINLLLSTGVHGRRTDGMLPQAEMAFLDEIFKANSAILNTLLSITNERIFYNMGQAFKVNLAFIVGASNETPDEEELGALYDRFPIRVPCMLVKTGDDVKKVVEQAHKFESAKEFQSIKESQDAEPEHQIIRYACLNDIRLLSKIIQSGMYGGIEPFENDSLFKDLFFKIFLEIRNDYGVSDRTPVQILRLCRALAMLDGESLSAKHLKAWGYVAPKLTSSIDLQRFIKAQILKIEPQEVDLFDEI